MRSKWWFILLVIVAVAGNNGISFTAAAGRGKAPKKAPPAMPRAFDPDENMVEGFGETAPAARNRALVHGQERVEKLLRERFREANWTPPQELLAAEALTHYGVLEEQGKPEPAKGLGDDRAMVSRYKVQLTNRYLEKVQSVAREHRVEERHKLLARMLGGLVVLLLVVAGYLRLEDMTRGYATTILRVMAVSLVALTCGALWLTR
jgi:hypothetical protein